MQNIHNNYVVGECMEMCPEDEIKMSDKRERQKLIHLLEVPPGTNNKGIKVANKRLMIKAYCRSAAGKATGDPRTLRPPKVLLRTVKYLLNNILPRNDVPWTVIYEFVLDRLRSVRQDMVIQNLAPRYFIDLLQPMIRFHAYAAYRLCEEPINLFDPHINNTHLQECLKRLLCAYDCCDELLDSYKDTESNPFWKSRPNFEAMYLILNLGNNIAITRALNLSNKWRTKTVESALQISLCCSNNNFVRAFRIIKTLPILLLMMASLHIPDLRRNALKIMSSAYSSKNLTFPVEILKALLLYDENDDLIKECRHYGLEVHNNNVHFLKNSFDLNKAAMHVQQLKFIDQKLSIVDIPKFIFVGE